MNLSSKVGGLYANACICSSKVGVLHANACICFAFKNMARRHPICVSLQVAGQLAREQGVRPSKLASSNWNARPCIENACDSPWSCKKRAIQGNKAKYEYNIM